MTEQRGVGQPPKSPDGVARSVSIRLPVTPGERDRLRKLAIARGLSVVEYVRRCSLPVLREKMDTVLDQPEKRG